MTRPAGTAGKTEASTQKGPKVVGKHGFLVKLELEPLMSQAVFVFAWTSFWTSFLSYLQL